MPISEKAVEAFLNELPNQALRIGMKVVLAFLVCVIGVQLIKLIRKIVKKALTRAKADVGVIQFLDSLIKTVLYIVLAFLIAGNFGLQATSIVAIIGSAGVAVGLALQGSLSNLAGGVLILLLKPFHVGDYIIEDSHKNEGTVTEISLFYTKLSTLDNKTVILPNGTLANNSMTNVTTARKRCVLIKVGISYDADLLKAKDTLYRILKEYEKTIENSEVTVYVDELAGSEVTLGGKFWVKTNDYWISKWTVTEQIKLIFDQEGIEIPYQQLDIHMKEKNPD